MKAYRDEGDRRVEGAGTDIVHSCLLCIEFSESIKKTDDGLYEFPLILESSLVRIGYDLVVTTKRFYETQEHF